MQVLSLDRVSHVLLLLFLTSTVLSGAIQRGSHCCTRLRNHNATSQKSQCLWGQKCNATSYYNINSDRSLSTSIPVLFSLHWCMRIGSFSCPPPSKVRVMLKCDITQHPSVVLYVHMTHHLDSRERNLLHNKSHSGFFEFPYKNFYICSLILRLRCLKH